MSREQYSNTIICAQQVDVNGPSIAPVYQFLKSSAGGFLGDLIKWNFENSWWTKMVKLLKYTNQQHHLFKLRYCFPFFFAFGLEV